MKRRLVAFAAPALALSLVVTPGLEAAPPSRCGPVSEPLVAALVKQAPGLHTEVLRMALEASGCASGRGLVRRPELLTVIDYSRPSTEPRMFVFDLRAKKILFREHVAHGVGSGGNVPNQFSNTPSSRQTSLGLFVTQESYVGANGYSLRLRGLEKGVNDRARERAIVMHGAPYVNPAAARAQGRLGRSWGCPAVRSAVARKMIDTIKGGSPIFAYYPERSWLASSGFLSVDTATFGS
ncbi:MAG TPA: murein L,D-transpeptidase catalytic domain family protein [Thermoanaerobaculia bacterium]|nr:murein L,D-transpeptidase catalytic domain family protein [Thermoanaerobaculia bacterium]